LLPKMGTCRQSPFDIEKKAIQNAFYFGIV